MGRTNPTYRDYLQQFAERWQPFKRALRRKYQGQFETLMEQGERFADAASFQNSMDPEHSVLLSMLLGHETELNDLKERVDELEAEREEGDEF